MSVVVAGLTVVGATTVGVWACRSVTSALRVLKVAEAVQTSAATAVSTIRDPSLEDFQKVGAVAAWERSRSMIRALSRNEQGIVLETIKERGFPIVLVAREIDEFVERRAVPDHQLDQELAEIVLR